MIESRFRQVDVFTTVPFLGNPVAVVLEADGLTAEQMQTFARWTNLSETTFVLPPEHTDADYRLRIFTPGEELPFAGHPTLGSAHAWLEAGGRPKGKRLVQECGAGLVTLRRDGQRLAFAAPPLVRSGPVEDDVRARVIDVLRIDPASVVDVHWVDNGPRWIGVLVDSAATVLGVDPTDSDLNVGVIGPSPEGCEQRFEVRAFFEVGGRTFEDPVTGSVNASLAQWLIGAGLASPPYAVRQGTVLGRSGRVEISVEDGAVWVGGGTVTCIEGMVRL